MPTSAGPSTTKLPKKSDDATSKNTEPSNRAWYSPSRVANTISKAGPWNRPWWGGKGTTSKPPTTLPPATQTAAAAPTESQTEPQKRSFWPRFATLRSRKKVSSRDTAKPSGLFGRAASAVSGAWGATRWAAGLPTQAAKSTLGAVSAAAGAAASAVSAPFRATGGYKRLWPGSRKKTPVQVAKSTARSVAGAAASAVSAPWRAAEAGYDWLRGGPNKRRKDQGNARMTDPVPSTTVPVSNSSKGKSSRSKRRSATSSGPSSKSTVSARVRELLKSSRTTTTGSTLVDSRDSTHTSTADNNT